MGAFRALQRGSGCRRIEQQLDETPLILDREADEVSLFDRSMRSISGGSDDEVAESPALKLGGAPDDGELGRCDACLDACCAVGFTGHRNPSLEPHCTAMPRTIQGISQGPLRQILELVEALQGAVHHVLDVLVAGQLAPFEPPADGAQEGDQVFSRRAGPGAAARRCAAGADRRRRLLQRRRDRSPHGRGVGESGGAPKSRPRSPQGWDEPTAHLARGPPPPALGPTWPAPGPSWPARGPFHPARGTLPPARGPP